MSSAEITWGQEEAGVAEEDLEQLQHYSAWFFVSLAYARVNRDRNQPHLVGKQGPSRTSVSPVQIKPADTGCHGKRLLSTLQPVIVSDCIDTAQ